MLQSPTIAGLINILVTGYSVKQGGCTIELQNCPTLGRSNEDTTAKLGVTAHMKVEQFNVTNTTTPTVGYKGSSFV